MNRLRLPNPFEALRSRSGRILAASTLAGSIALGPSGCHVGRDSTDSTSTSAPASSSSPETTAASIPDNLRPSCHVEVRSLGAREYEFWVSTNNVFVRGLYTVDNIDYDFGDNQKALDVPPTSRVSHPYTQAGEYTIRATMDPDVAQGQSLPDSKAILCETRDIVIPQ